ncbi:hypothetical protein LCGC14_1285060 [marine sediment metagenome]|uniref:Uncharacterized protein n=1 Tax=marine sediment metagenome TaxID=412755 RepID=A0A0F9NAT3_9ZZZZ
MNYFTEDSLTNSLEGRISYIKLNDNDGSVIISEYGGRPLGLFPKNNSYNLLWVNPKIQEVFKTKSHVIGGDRYWISPERDFFFKNPETWEDWECPSGLDPANYEILGSSDSSCTVSSPLFVFNQRTKQGYQGEITRQFKIIKEPYKTGVGYCGLEFLDDCVFFRPNLKINGWSLATIISGGLENPGTVLIPTKNSPVPLSYFSRIPNDRLRIMDNYVAYKIDVDAIYKLAIRPEDIDYNRPAKIGYILKLPESEEYGFIVKLSDDLPRNQNECFDVSRDHPDSEIGVIQSYNSESPHKPMLNYGEIELQLNPFVTIDNASHSKAKHQLFGYIGTKEEILDVVEKFLGIDNPKLF